MVFLIHTELRCTVNHTSDLLNNIHQRTTPILAIENRRGNFIRSISNMPLTLSTRKLLNDSGQIVTYRGLIIIKNGKIPKYKIS